MAALGIRAGFDAHDVALDPVQPGMDAVFDAARGHQLHADADAEEGLAALDHLALQGIDHARHAVEAGAAVGEGADARQHDAVGRRPRRAGSTSPARDRPRPLSRAARSKAFAAERRLPDP